MPDISKSREDNLIIPVEDGLELRLITMETADDFYYLAKADLEHLRPWIGWANDNMSLETNRKGTQESIDKYHEGTAYLMGIYENGKPVGSVDVRNLDGKTAEPEIGSWLIKSAEGRGISTKAHIALIDYTLQHHPIKRMVLHTNAGNDRAAKLAERIGFTFETEVENEETGIKEKKYVKDF